MLDLVRRALKRVLRLVDGPPELPAGEHPELFHSSPRHRTYLLAAWALKHGVGFMALAGTWLLAGVGAAQTQPQDLWVVVVLAAITCGLFSIQAFVGYASIRLDWEMRWYVLTDRSLRIREGIVQLREVTLTLANVQEIKASQGPLQRLFGITDLIVDTAGGGGSVEAATGGVQAHHGILRGVDVDSNLREKIAARVQMRRGAGLGDADEPDDGATVSAGDDAFITALRAVRDEARALRETVRR